MVAKKVRKKKKVTISTLKKKRDELYSRYIRIKSSDKDGYSECVTCGLKAHWKKLQCGHYVSRRYLSLRWDEGNTFPQCVGCNMFKSGNMDEYTMFLVGEYGFEHLRRLAEKKREVVKLTVADYYEEIDKLKDLLADLMVGKDIQRGM